MSEIIYQSRHSGKKIDDNIDKVDVLEANMEDKADKTDALIFESVFNGSGDLNTANKTNKWYKIDTSAGVLNTPPTTLIPDAGWAALYVQGNGLGSFVQTLYSGGYNKVLKRSYFNGIYTPWQEIATTNKIDILSTDLLNGWYVWVSVYTPRLSKTGNTVTINGALIAGTITANTPVFNITDTSFRPTANRLLPVSCSDGKNRNMIVKPNGDIVVDNDSFSTDWATGLKVLFGTSYII